MTNRTGVPQVSIMGPLSFLLFVTDTYKYLHLSLFKRFADCAQIISKT